MFVFVIMFYVFFFFYTVPATTEIYTYLHSLSLHDALPIEPVIADCIDDGGVIPVQALVAHALVIEGRQHQHDGAAQVYGMPGQFDGIRDRKSTRLNSSH